MALHRLGDDESSPIKRIARQLSMKPVDVAFVIYPIEVFGPWEDDNEPDLPEKDSEGPPVVLLPICKLCKHI